MESPTQSQPRAWVWMGASSSTSIYLGVEWAQAPAPASVTLGESRLRDMVARSLWSPGPGVRFVAWKELRAGWFGDFGDPAPSGRPGVGPRQKVLWGPAEGAGVCASGGGGGGGAEEHRRGPAALIKGEELEARRPLGPHGPR